MNRLLAVVLGAVVLVGLTFVAVTYLADDAALTAAAESRPEMFRFESAGQFRTAGEPVADAAVDELVAELDVMIVEAEAAKDSDDERERSVRSPRSALRSYGRILGGSNLTADQEAKVLAHLDGLAEAHPDDVEHYEATRFVVENLTLGKVAPNIVGTDFDGEEFELADYRGKVVALVFSGDWCGPCRGEYPFQRTLLEVTDEEDFVLLGINSDKSLEIATEAKKREHLSYRTWWDGHAEKSTDGPIAELYQVDAWPTIYVLDEEGVIRNRGARREKLITLAKEMTAELRQKRAAEAEAANAAGADETPAPRPVARPMSDIGFLSPSEYDTGGEPFADAVVDDLMATLDGLLARPETLADFEREAGTHLWRYSTRLTTGMLTDEQEARVIAHLNGLAEAHPDHAGEFEATAFMVENLMLGKEAPNIVGNDLDGVEFELADYRGKIVAVVFTGYWCGPCRSEYPYQRLLLEVVDEEDFVLLGVNSDEDLEVAKQAKIDEGLLYRTWWDGHAEESTKGPIATLYNVSGWPTIYVIDENGVVRNRGARHENLITVVQDLVREMKRKQASEQ